MFRTEGASCLADEGFLVGKLTLLLFQNGSKYIHWVHDVVISQQAVLFLQSCEYNSTGHLCSLQTMSVIHIRFTIRCQLRGKSGVNCLMGDGGVVGFGSYWECNIHSLGHVY